MLSCHLSAPAFTALDSQSWVYDAVSQSISEPVHQDSTLDPEVFFCREEKKKREEKKRERREREEREKEEKRERRETREKREKGEKREERRRRERKKREERNSERKPLLAGDAILTIML